MAARILSVMSRISSSCIGLTSGRPRKVRASSGVQSMSMVTFIAVPPLPRSIRRAGPQRKRLSPARDGRIWARKTRRQAMSDFPDWHGTTIVAVRKGGEVVVAGDGQVTLGQTVIKGTARKVRRLTPGGHEIVAGFAGS